MKKPYARTTAPSPHHRSVAPLLFLALGTLMLGACKKAPPEPTGPFVPDVARGKTMVLRYGCRACHMIPDIPGRVVKIGPSLENFAARSIIGGKLENTPENVVRWIRDPRSINPQTGMPTMGITDHQAQDIAAYLATIK